MNHKRGIVIKSTGSWYQVRLEENQEVILCRIIGKFRLENMILTNPVAVGDVVEIAPEGNEGNAVIKKILARRNYIARQSPRQTHNLHLMAANVDQVILFSTIIDPDIKVGFIDRFLLMTEPQSIPTIIVFNKADLWDESVLLEWEYVKTVYGNIGYKTICVSALDGTGIEDLRTLLKDKITLISGQSGVGKSTTINALQPQLNLRTGDISEYSGKGQHTTTFAEMHPLDFGGSIVDTPGIKMLAFNNLEPIQVAHHFRELFILSNNCKFGGSCLHRNEPKCAVKDALAEGAISETRYNNYLQILEEVEDINYWERHKDL